MESLAGEESNRLRLGGDQMAWRRDVHRYGTGGHGRGHRRLASGLGPGRAGKLGGEWDGPVEAAGKIGPAGKKLLVDPPMEAPGLELGPTRD